MKIEIDKYKIQVGALQEEIRRLRQASVNIQARAEQEEEYISNTLLKKIEELKKEKVDQKALIFIYATFLGNASKLLREGRRILDKSAQQET